MPPQTQRGGLPCCCIVAGGTGTFFSRESAMPVTGRRCASCTVTPCTRTTQGPCCGACCGPGCETAGVQAPAFLSHFLGHRCCCRHGPLWTHKTSWSYRLSNRNMTRKHINWALLGATGRRSIFTWATSCPSPTYIARLLSQALS